MKISFDVPDETFKKARESGQVVIVLAHQSPRAGVVLDIRWGIMNPDQIGYFTAPFQKREAWLEQQAQWP